MDKREGSVDGSVISHFTSSMTDLDSKTDERIEDWEVTETLDGVLNGIGESELGEMLGIEESSIVEDDAGCKSDTGDSEG